MELRPYQTAAINGLYSYFARQGGNPLICMPTGTGKSAVAAGFLQRALHDYPETRVILLTHVREIVSQNFKALLRLWPDAPCGIYSAGLGRRDLGGRIVFAGIQSVFRLAHEMVRVDLVIIDEAHRLNRSDRGMYSRFLTELRRYNKALKIVGLTATPYRKDSGLLTEGKDRLFTDIAFEVPLLEMIEQGYLCPVVSKSAATQLDVTGVGTRAGEFIQGQLEAAVDKEPVTLAAVKEIVALGADRGSWLCFCSGVKHALHVRDAIREHGISCETVTGDMPSHERDRILDAFKSGQLRAVTNVNCWTTGFDHAGLDLIALLRPTKSTSLYVQMVGRGTRICNGKSNCLVLDFSGNVKRHGPIDTVDGRRKAKVKGGDAPVKTCDACSSIVHASVRECPDCGQQFPVPEIKTEMTAAIAPLLSTQIEDTWVPVNEVTYARHKKPGSPPSLRVHYQCGLVVYKEWCCLEHTGYPREKACQWWSKRAPGTPVPRNVTDALERVSTLAKPSDIRIRPSGKFLCVTGARFA